MRTAAASASSRSARPWARRRPPTTTAPPAGAQSRVVEDQRLLERIREVHAANYYAYGYRRTWKALRRAGEPVGRDHVRRLMRAHGIQGAKRRGKPWRTTITDPAARRSPDRVERNFSASRPDALWVADFTYLRCWEGMVFFAFVIDVYSRRVVGWQLAGDMRTDLVLDALRMALSRRHAGADVELIHHSDAGAQGGFQRSSQRSMKEVAMGRPRGWGAQQTGRPVMRSPGRPPVGRREHRQRFWAAIARGERSDVAGVEAGVSPVVGVRWFREAGGMPPMSQAPLSGRYLSFVEREEIAVLRAGGCGVREVARRLGRSPSTISRELRRNAATRSGRLEYRATTAQWHADQRAKRPKPAKLAVNERLRGYVQERLVGRVQRPDGVVLARRSAVEARSRTSLGTNPAPRARLVERAL